MPVRTVSSSPLASVIESIGGNAGDAVTKTTTTVDADTDVVNVASGADCTVSLDFAISKHEIFYGDKKTADSQSDKETRTVREHEYGHVGARNALASKTLLEALCKDVGVNWKFHAADQAEVDKKSAEYESAVEDFINPLIDYLDEYVVHETQRNAGKVGRPTDSQLSTQLGAISYTDPATGTAKKPGTNVIAQAVKATKTGEGNGEAHAKKTPTPPGVK